MKSFFSELLYHLSLLVHYIRDTGMCMFSYCFYHYFFNSGTCIFFLSFPPITFMTLEHTFLHLFSITFVTLEHAFLHFFSTYFCDTGICIFHIFCTWFRMAEEVLLVLPQRVCWLISSTVC